MSTKIPPALLSPRIEVGQVQLNTADKAAMLHFYRDLVGLEMLSETERTTAPSTTAENTRPQNTVVLGFENKAIITLYITADLSPASTYHAGLYHNAILFSSRAQLAETLERMLRMGSHFFSGSADHHVSEAFYFTDPEGNGLELYFDRDPATWQWQNGQVVMGATYIDPREYIVKHSDISANDNSDEGKSADLDSKKLNSITMGHIHLKVGSIQQARNFYVDVLGLVVTAELPGALFVSDGKYHHHLGLNVWESQGAAVRTESLGLRSLELLVQSDDDIRRLAERLAEAAIPFGRQGQEVTFFDPWENVISVRAF